MNIQKILSFSIEDKIGHTIKNHLEAIKLFFIIFAVNIIIFGQKIFFYSLATDDYSRYYTHGNEMYLTRVSGRWAQDLLNNHIFIDGLHVLPYFHGIIGVLSFTLLGFLTAKYFKQKNALIIFITTLLISTTPMFAHNLYFNTNITMWITISLGVIGFLLAYKPNIFLKFTGFIFLVIAIGNYQTIVQLIIAMILFKTMIELLEVENLKEIKSVLFSSFFFVLFVLFAYVTSVAVNEFFIYYYHLSEGGRYKTAENISGLSIYLDRIIKMYQNFVDPYYLKVYYFKIQFITLYVAMACLSVVGIIFTVLKRKVNNNIKIFSLLLLLLLLLLIPMIINLPLITGNGIPLRAHFTIGWILAGLFIIQILSFKGILKTISTTIAISIIVVSTYYIHVFFDAGSRQTSSDITRVNQIVNRIRLDQNYIEEPLKFKIVGEKSFPVIGWKFHQQQALNTDWSKYGIFKNFTDLKYTKIDNKEYEEIINNLIQEGKEINAYPGKGSIMVYKDKAILFLNPNKINTEIKFSKLANLSPKITSTFNLYIEDKNLYYFKSPCSEKDIKHRFFLYVFPTDTANLSKNKQKYGFKKMNFKFSSFGQIRDNKCIVYIKLPNYSIKTIQTGQYEGSKRNWEETYFFDNNSNPKFKSEM